VQITWPVRHLL